MTDIPPLFPNAAEVHARAFVVDAHADTVGRQLGRGADRVDLSGQGPQCDLDVAKLRAGNVGLQVFACSVGDEPTWKAARRVGLLLEEVERHPDDWLLIREASDLDRVRQSDRIGCLIALEGAVPLRADPGVLHTFRAAGVRLITLSHMEQTTPWSAQGDASYFGLCNADFRRAERENKRGLTPWGRELIGRMNALGMVVDLAHCNDATFWDALELSAQPVVFSHGCTFALCPQARNLTDEQLRAVAKNGGVVGLAYFDEFVAESGGDLDGLLDHFEHAVAVAGPEHVGLGSDYDGLPSTTTPLVPDPSQLPHLTEGLLRRGLSESTVLGILGDNFARVFREVLGAGRLRA